MSAKTIFIIVVAVLVTIILMKNTDEVNFWIFGEASIPKLAVLGVMFGLGLISGFLLGRPRKKPAISTDSTDYEQEQHSTARPGDLSNEDREYIN
ncbi:MAG: hypothetical protein WBP45_07680 [Daejeonella sp.]